MVIISLDQYLSSSNSRHLLRKSLTNTIWGAALKRRSTIRSSVASGTVLITHCEEIPIIPPNRRSIGIRKEAGNVAVPNRPGDAQTSEEGLKDMERDEMQS